MAYVTAEIKIPEAAVTVATRLYFPTDLPAEVGNKVKGVITLLHGLGNTSSDWMQYSAAPRYAADNGYILVAPDTQNSFSSDMAFGPPWYTILTQWLPGQLQRIFHIPQNRELNAIAGLSMGGYGALRIGLAHPQRYAAIGSFSGAVDMQAMAAAAKQNPAYGALLAPVLGPGLAVPPEMDLPTLAKQAATLPKENQPRIFCTCGTRDNDEMQVKTQNANFRAAVKGLPLNLTYREWDGVHEWNFWDRSLAEFIGFFQNSDYGQRKKADWAD